MKTADDHEIHAGDTLFLSLQRGDQRPVKVKKTEVQTAPNGTPRNCVWFEGGGMVYTPEPKFYCLWKEKRG